MPDDEPPAIDLENGQDVQQALIDGSLEECICWSAIFDADTTAFRGGLILLFDNGKPKRVVEGNLDPASDPFHYVLGGD